MKIDKNGYHVLSDGARFRLNLSEDWLLLACCGCCLVHRLRFKVIDEDKIEVRITREEKETARLRRKPR